MSKTKKLEPLSNKNPIDFDEILSEQCPSCGSALKSNWPRGGVVCTDDKCGYWFCF